MNTSISSQQTIPFDERATTTTTTGTTTTTTPQQHMSGIDQQRSSTYDHEERNQTESRQSQQQQHSRIRVTTNSNSSRSVAMTTNPTNHTTTTTTMNHSMPPPPPLRSSQMTSSMTHSTPNTTMHQPHGAPAIGPSRYHPPHPSPQPPHPQQQQFQHPQQYSSVHLQNSSMGYMNHSGGGGGGGGGGGVPSASSDQNQNHPHNTTTNTTNNNNTTTTSPLPPMVLRSLGDRSNEKRKNAALEIEALIKLLTESNNFGTINAIITVLSKDFCTSMNSNYRKGGLVGLAATAIGLHTATNNFLQILLPPVLHCFDDPESRVRYYACESIYNMAKVTRQGILLYFNPIFDGLTKLFADVDVDVKNGANLLDRLIKDIVTEADVDTFQVDQFLPVMQNYIRRTNPYIRQLIVGWITLLDSLPDLSLLDYLPDFLDGLLNMLSDSNREIRQAADAALSDFLRELSSSEVLEFGPIIAILVLQCQSKERLIRLTSITWLAELSHHPLSGGDAMLPFLPDMLSAILYCICDPEKEIRMVAERTNDDLLQFVRETKGEFDLRPLLETLTTELLEKEDVPTKMASLRWINMLKEKRMQDMHAYTVNLLPVLLRTLSDPSDAVVLLDLQILSRISLATSNDTPSTVTETVITTSSNELPSVSASASATNSDKEEKGPDSPSSLSSQQEPKEAQFQLVLNAILNLFAQDRQLLETRGSLIIRKLCVLLNAKAVYIRMAETLSSYESKYNIVDHPDTAAETMRFISTMVQTLNLILLTASELHDLRDTLANSFEKDKSMVVDTGGDNNDEDDKDGTVFQTIFRCWCHSPIATFSLCLLAKAYDLSFQLVQRFSEMRDVTVGFLMQIDKLVYLLESPIFIHLRLQLLNVESPNHAQLLKSLYGILMCLPQGEAFRLLNDRLTTVCNLRDNLGYSTFPLEMNDTTDDRSDGAIAIVQKPDRTVTRQLLERYDTVAELHRHMKDITSHKVSTAAPALSDIGSSNVTNFDGTSTNHTNHPSSPTNVPHPHHKSGSSNNHHATVVMSTSYGANNVDPNRNGGRSIGVEPKESQQHSSSITATDALLSRHPVATSLQ